MEMEKGNDNGRVITLHTVSLLQQIHSFLFSLHISYVSNTFPLHFHFHNTSIYRFTLHVLFLSMEILM